MGSTINYEDCPHCKREGTLYAEYNYKSGEIDHFCMECGYIYARHFKRDENDEIVTRQIEFDRASCFFRVVDYGNNKVLWEKSAADVGDFTSELLTQWHTYGAPFMGEKLPNGYKEIIFVGDEDECLYGMGRYIDAKKCDDVFIVVQEAEYEESTYEGCGVINVRMASGGGSSSSVGEGSTKEDVIEEVNYIKEHNPDTVIGVYATWFNKETQKLEVISDFG